MRFSISCVFVHHSKTINGLQFKVHRCSKRKLYHKQFCYFVPDYRFQACFLHNVLTTRSLPQTQQAAKRNCNEYFYQRRETEQAKKRKKKRWDEKESVFFLEKSNLTFPNLFKYLYLYFRNSIKTHSKFKFCCDQKTKSDRWFTFTVILFGKNNHLILNTSTVYFSHTVIGKQFVFRFVLRILRCKHCRL